MFRTPDYEPSIRRHKRLALRLKKKVKQKIEEAANRGQIRWLGELPCHDPWSLGATFTYSPFLFTQGEIYAPREWYLERHDLRHKNRYYVPSGWVYFDRTYVTKNILKWVELHERVSSRIRWMEATSTLA